jgi:hypothetical protein
MNKHYTVLIILLYACSSLSLDILIMGNVPLPIISIHSIKFVDDNINVYEGGEYVGGIVSLNIDNLLLQFTAHADMNIPLEEINSNYTHIGYELGIRPYYKLGSGATNLLASIGIRYAYHSGHEQEYKHLYNNIQYWAEPYINIDFSECSLSLGAGAYYGDHIGLILSLHYGTMFNTSESNDIEYTINIDYLYSKNFYDFKFGVFIGYTI